MPDASYMGDFRNASLAALAIGNAKLNSCSDLEKSQHGLYQVAHLFYAAALLIPHHTFVWSIFITRFLMGLTYALVTVWACLELCAPDVFAWNALLTAASLVHIVYWSWHFRPGRIRQRPLLQLYQKLFLPLDCSQELFVQLTKKSVIQHLQVGDDYFVATQQFSTSISSPSVPFRLSVLLKGKMRVTFGLGNRFLHHIEPFQFVDSIEWFTMQNIPSQDVRSSKIRVSITANEPCMFLQLDTDQLSCLAVTNPPLKFLLDCLIGKDVSQKLYAVAEHAALIGTARDCKQDRMQSLQVSSGGGSVGANSTTTYSSLGPWQGELLRSQSADAVHTCKQGQVRSIHWKRDQTRKVWARRYQKLVPSRYYTRPLMKWSPDERQITKVNHREEKEKVSDCATKEGNTKHQPVANRSRHQEIRTTVANHPAQFRPRWNNKVQFGETFV